MSGEPQVPCRPTKVQFPVSQTAVRVSLIDSTTRLKAPLGYLMGPQIRGHDFFYGPSFSFLAEHPSGRRILFDLGMRKDKQNLAPKVYKMISQPKWNMVIEKNIAEIISENGLSPSEIEAVVWSHWHYDHLGDMTTFPSSTKVLVGHGFRNLLPGYPKNLESSILESDLAGRELVEINFAQTPVRIGGFDAFDYFGDGSFYLLEASGHAVGHMCGLARTTLGQDQGKDDTFVLMAADTCHHAGLFRPTKYLPLPGDIRPSPLRAKVSCPGSIFQHVHRDGSSTTEFYQMAKRFPHDYDTAEQNIRALEEMDALDNVFVILAHDDTLLDESLGIPVYPTGILNDWREKDLSNKSRWLFLKDFEQAAEAGEKQDKELGDGLVLDH